MTIVVQLFSLKLFTLKTVDVTTVLNQGQLQLKYQVGLD
jgi:hypothetical protein